MNTLTSIPGQLIGYRKNGLPIYLIAGGSPEGDEPPAETPPAEGDTPPEGEPKEGTGTEGAEGGDEPSEEELPEHWRKELSKTRTEAAKYRTSLREAEAKLANAKTPEEVEAAVAEFRTRNATLERELLVTKVANKYSLPADLAEALKGDDEAALEAHAKRLAKYATAPEPQVSGGLDPSGHDDDPSDPREIARRVNRRR